MRGEERGKGRGDKGGDVRKVAGVVVRKHDKRGRRGGEKTARTGARMCYDIPDMYAAHMRHARVTDTPRCDNTDMRQDAEE